LVHMKRLRPVTPARMLRALRPNDSVNRSGTL
jgi:hypothetical protein